MTKLISVIVPVYNVEKYLSRCVESLLGQAYPNVEVILVNDGSTDGSAAVCERYAEQNEQVKVLHKENGGLSDARNAGKEIAAGDYLIFIDSDDFIHEQTLQIMWENLEETGADVSVCGYLEFYEGEEVHTDVSRQERKVMSNLEALEKIFDPVSGVQTVIATNKLYRRELLQDIQFPFGKIHEDEFTTYRIIYAAQKVVYTDLPLYYYLQRRDSITGSKQFSRKHFLMFDAFEERTRFFEARGLTDLAYCSLQSALNQLINVYLDVKAVPPEDEELLDMLKERFDHLYRTLGADYQFTRKDGWKNKLFYTNPNFFPAFQKLVSFGKMRKKTPALTTK